MRKSAIVALSLMLGFIGYCAYRASVTPEELNPKGLYAPNVMHKVQLPPGTPPPAEFFAQFDTGIRTVKLAKFDQQTISQAEMRKLYRVHEFGSGGYYHNRAPQ